MNSKNTWFLLTAAALLAGFIYSWETFLAGPSKAPELVLPGLNPDEIDRVQIRVSGYPEILAERTNHTWRLIKPLPTRARPQRVEALLKTLVSLKTQGYLTPRELADQPDVEADFGFKTPQVSIMLFNGKARRQILIGAHTAPGDQLFVEVVGTPGIHLVSTNLVSVIPQKPGDWRDTALFESNSVQFDRVQINNGSRTIELVQNRTNLLWRLARLQARADGQLVEQLLGQLKQLQIDEFISDDPDPELSEYGLEVPSLEILLSQGSNVVDSLQFGQTNGTSTVYGRRGGSPTIFTVSAGKLNPWRVPATDFRDRHLLALPTVPSSIEVRGMDQFTLQRGTNSLWRVMPQDFIADTNYMNDVISTLAQMKAVEFVKDVVTQPDLPGYGLDPSAREYIINFNGTNASNVHLLFGTNRDDVVYTKRADEPSVSAVRLVDFNFLPGASWEMRDRRVWRFTEHDVARVLIEQDGRKRELIRNGTNAWSVAEGSFGVISPAAVEETVHRLGDLSAAFWKTRGTIDRAQYGFADPPHKVTVTLKDGTTHGVEFGGTAPSQFPYALVMLDGEPWVLEFPWDTAQFIESYLSIPVREL
jgi:hypothetical protein